MKEKIQLNVLGNKLITCSKEPLTGFRRNGCCDAHQSDYGKHLICAILNEKFLEFQFSKGNDLITPAPHFNFPGLKAGDRWCVCARTWLDAAENGVACPVNLEATHEEALSIIPFDLLETHAV